MTTIKTTNGKKRVCVVGAGAAGLCAARHLAADASLEFCVFEQANDVGGTWIYEEDAKSKENQQIHSSMYKNLRTNLPSTIMNFPDYQTMGNQDHQTSSCLTHQQVLGYLRNYTEHFNLRNFIEFNTKVLQIRPEISVDKQTCWQVTTENINDSVRKNLEFDFIMVCNGHYFDPKIPNLSGIESFPGRISHSHLYRKPDGYLGKIVFVLGASSSGIDIGFDLSTHASRVYISHNNERLSSSLPVNVTELYGVERIEVNKIYLKDGTHVIVDDIIFCTGYNYSFPFLDNNCDIRVDENYVTPLYKHFVNIKHPTMCIVGVPSVIVPFPLFHMQVKYFLALIKKSASLPPESEMLEDSRLKSGVKKRHAHKLAAEQWEYNDWLATAGHFERLPSFYKIGYTIWGKRKKADLLHYKDSKLVLSDDGTVLLVTQ